MRSWLELGVKYGYFGRPTGGQGGVVALAADMEAYTKRLPVVQTALTDKDFDQAPYSVVPADLEHVLPLVPGTGAGAGAVSTPDEGHGSKAGGSERASVPLASRGTKRAYDDDADSSSDEGHGHSPLKQLRL